MARRYVNLIRGISANWVSKFGVALATSTFIIFVFAELLQVAGFIRNAYVGLITYLLFPSLFVLGLMLIPLGWFLYRKRTGKKFGDLLDHRFEVEEVRGGLLGSKLIRTVGVMTLINVLFLGIASTRTLHFMDQAHFCGTACHSVMNPEWVTYQQSPHARVNCVECHVGEGFEALVDSKLNGAWQIISLTFDLYERPIPTPVHNLRPARETCEKCHWPEKFLGNRLKIVKHYELDEESTLKYTTLNVKVGSGEEGFESGSHWHVSQRNEVQYKPADEDRNKIAWVEVRQPDGSFIRYNNNLISEKEKSTQHPVRTMDCVDCHNRATHIYKYPELAVDSRISKGLIAQSLPFIKREGLAAISKNYPDKGTGKERIAIRIENFYRENYPGIFSTKTAQIDSAISALLAIYDRNIHPRMKINWGSYPNQLGHRRGPGCFRCHNSNMVDESGKNISNDCTICHSILAHEEDEPFKYLYPVDETGNEAEMQQYLQDEFKQSY